MASKICGAKTRAGKRCNNKPIAGKRRCRLHGGLSTGAPKGNKHNLKHGMYSRIFTDEQLDEAQAMQGTVSRELAIARIQLVNCINHRKAQGDTPELDEIKDETLADEEDEDTVKKARARDAQRCGEYYDPDEDDYSGQESEPLKRTRVYRRRDWATEETRLISLIAKLEMQLVKQAGATLELEQRKKLIEAAERRESGSGRNVEEMTDDELNSCLERLLKS